MKLARETWYLILLCTLDMVSTAWLLTAGRAQEANPVMRFYVAQGVPTFMVVKAFLYIAPLFVLELLRRRKPEFIRGILRLGIAAYLLVYGIGVLRANAPNSFASAQERTIVSASR